MTAVFDQCKHKSCSLTNVRVGSFLIERSRYGYDDTVRIGDGCTPHRWVDRLQKECVVRWPRIELPPGEGLIVLRSTLVR